MNPIRVSRHSQSRTPICALVFVLGSSMALAENHPSVAGLPGSSVEFLMIPVQPPPGFPPYPLGTTIVDRDITLPQGGISVWLELHIRNWDPDRDGSPRLNAWQTWLVACDFLGAQAEPPGVVDLHPVLEECSAATPQAGSGCQDFFSGPLASAHCVSDVNMRGCPYSFCCVPAWVDKLRPDWIGGPNNGFGFAVISAPAHNYAFGGGSGGLDDLIDDGLSTYAGTLVMHVPPAAAGAYTIDMCSVLDTSACETSSCQSTFVQFDYYAGPIDVFEENLLPATIAIVRPPIGVCCDTRSGNCDDGVAETECDGPGRRWTEGGQCSQLGCTVVSDVPATSSLALAVITVVLGLTIGRRFRRKGSETCRPQRPVS